MTFTAEAPGIRFASVRYGDSIKKIALRELGSAADWTQLVILNALIPPYIAETASPGVLGFGDAIKIPAPAGRIESQSSAADVLGIDIRLVGGVIDADEDGDVSTIAGADNFVQALRLRIAVERGELGFHPDYGCWVRLILGSVSGPTATKLAAMYVKSSLIADERVAEVESCIATAAGDQISVVARVVPVSGRNADLTVVI